MYTNNYHWITLILKKLDSQIFSETLTELWLDFFYFGLSLLHISPFSSPAPSRGSSWLCSSIQMGWEWLQKHKRNSYNKEYHILAHIQTCAFYFPSIGYYLFIQPRQWLEACINLNDTGCNSSRVSLGQIPSHSINTINYSSSQVGHRI